MWNLLIYMNCKNLKATDVGNKKRIVELGHSVFLKEKLLKFIQQPL